MREVKYMKKRFIIGVCIALALALGVSSYLFFNSISKRIDATTDEIRFKTDWETLNGKKNSDGRDYPILLIKDLSGVKYLTEEETINLIEGGTGIIYFGFPSCIWCRNSIPVFLNALDNNDIENFYYLDVENIRNIKELDDDNKVITTKEGSSGYRRLLELLDEYLDDYNLIDEKGNIVKTGTKRLFVPTVIFIKDGKVVGIHQNNMENNENRYATLTLKEREELNKIYNSLLKKNHNLICDKQEEGC